MSKNGNEKQAGFGGKVSACGIHTSLIADSHKCVASNASTTDVSNVVTIDATTNVSNGTTNEVTSVITNVGTCRSEAVKKVVKNAVGRVGGKNGRNPDLLFRQSLRLIEAGVKPERLLKPAMSAGLTEDEATEQIAAAIEEVSDGSYLTIVDRITEWERRATEVSSDQYIYLINALADNARKQLDMCPWLSIQDTWKKTNSPRRTIGRRLKDLEAAGLVFKKTNGKRANGLDNVSNFYLQIEKQNLWTVVVDQQDIDQASEEQHHTTVVVLPEKPEEEVNSDLPQQSQALTESSTEVSEVDEREWWEKVNEALWMSEPYDGTTDEHKSSRIDKWLLMYGEVLSDENVTIMKEGKATYLVD